MSSAKATRKGPSTKEEKKTAKATGERENTDCNAEVATLVEAQTKNYEACSLNSSNENVTEYFEYFLRHTTVDSEAPERHEQNISENCSHENDECILGIDNGKSEHREGNSQGFGDSAAAGRHQEQKTSDNSSLHDDDRGLGSQEKKKEHPEGDPQYPKGYRIDTNEKDQKGSNCSSPQEDEYDQGSDERKEQHRKGDPQDPIEDGAAPGQPKENVRRNSPSRDNNSGQQSEGSREHRGEDSPYPKRGSTLPKQPEGNVSEDTSPQDDRRGQGSDGGNGEHLESHSQGAEKDGIAQERKISETSSLCDDKACGTRGGSQNTRKDVTAPERQEDEISENEPPRDKRDKEGHGKGDQREGCSQGAREDGASSEQQEQGDRGGASAQQGGKRGQGRSDDKGPPPEDRKDAKGDERPKHGDDCLLAVEEADDFEDFPTDEVEPGVDLWEENWEDYDDDWEEEFNKRLSAEHSKLRKKRDPSK